MTRTFSRRSFARTVGGALGALTLGAPSAAAAASTDRYVVDLQSTDPGTLDGLEVVHDLSEIDIAIVRTSEDQVAGARAAPDVDLDLDLPVAEVDTTDSGAPGVDDVDPSSLQWDKQAQDLSAVHGTTRGEGTRVSIIDTGVLDSHPSLSGVVNTELSRNFTGDGGDHNPVASDHGTHVAGIVAANDVGTSVVGSAPETEIVALRVFSGPSATFGDILAAMTYSAQIGSDAANMSIGAYPLPLADPAVQVLIDAFERAADFAAAQGTLMVASAGNDATNLDADGNVISLPNEADDVMSISATGPIGYRWDDNGNGRFVRNHAAAFNKLREPTTDPAFYTNTGAEAVDVSAAGGDADLDAIGTGQQAFLDLVLNATFTGPDFTPSFGWKAGTSMAAPQIAGAAALVRSQNPGAGAREVRQHIEDTATDLGNATAHGEGHLDLLSAVNQSV